MSNENNVPLSKIYPSGLLNLFPGLEEIRGRITNEQKTVSAITKPENLISVPVCTLTGTLSCEGCPARYEYFVKGSEPKTHCDPQKIKEILAPKPTLSTFPSPQIL